MEGEGEGLMDENEVEKSGEAEEYKNIEHF